MEISEKDLKRIEKLSMLSIRDGAKSEIKTGLLNVFHWIEQLKSVNVENTLPLTNPVIELKKSTPLREDHPHLSHKKEEILLNAPDQNYGFFLVPKVVE